MEKILQKMTRIDTDLGENKLADMSDKYNDQSQDYIVTLGRFARYVDIINGR